MDDIHRFDSHTQVINISKCLDYLQMAFDEFECSIPRNTIYYIGSWNSNANIPFGRNDIRWLQ